MDEQEELKKMKKQFWKTFGVFMSIVGLLLVIYLVLSTLNFFG